MKIYRPIKRSVPGQKFGENRACYNPETDQVSYKSGSTCLTPSVDFYADMGMVGHPGIDFSSYIGQPLYFPVDDGGQEWISSDASDFSGGLGVDVRSKHPVPLYDLPTQTGVHAHRAWATGRLHVTFRFWHLHKAWPDVDVRLGEQIGETGNTGASNVPHLHMAMKFCNESGEVLDEDNGYFGSVDWSMYYEDRFILDVLGEKAQLSTSQQVAGFLFRLRSCIINQINSS